MSLAIEAFTDNVRTFCEWIEAKDHDFLKARQLLLSLMTSIPYLVALESGPPTEADYRHRSLEEWKATHANLANFPFQYYQQIFDPLKVDDGEAVMGDIHDDLADIYGDLQHGLQALENGNGIYAINHWRESYFQHWGAHAASALGAIDQYYRSNR